MDFSSDASDGDGIFKMHLDGITYVGLISNTDLSTI